MVFKCGMIVTTLLKLYLEIVSDVLTALGECTAWP